MLFDAPGVGGPKRGLGVCFFDIVLGRLRSFCKVDLLLLLLRVGQKLVDIESPSTKLIFRLSVEVKGCLFSVCNGDDVINVC